MTKALNKANVPKLITVQLTSMEAWVVLRALAAYDATGEIASGSKTWIAERILKLVQPVDKVPGQIDPSTSTSDQDV